MAIIASSGSFQKLITVLLTGALLLSGCVPPTVMAGHPTNTVMPAITVPTPVPASPAPAPTTVIPTSQPSSSVGTTVTFGPLTLVVPPGVASGASSRVYPRIDGEDAAWWQKAPGHLQLTLGDYYVLQGRSHQPQICVYPAQAYAELAPAAFEGLHRLDNILAAPDTPMSADQLPRAPFLNAQQVFASNIRVIAFQNGKGVRFLTQYAEYPAPVNNHDLFYHFQGVTRDGAYYIIAILPITAPMLADTSDPTAPLPSGGIAYPDISDPNVDVQDYYTAITDLLNGTSEDPFVPSINQLDLMMESMLIVP